MLSIRKLQSKNILIIKHVALIALLLAIIIIGFLLGAFINSYSGNQTFRATFVSDKPASLHSAA
jgi:hypothetical protein